MHQPWEYCAIATIRGMLGFAELYIVRLSTTNRQRAKIKHERGEDQEAAVLRTVATLGVQGWEMIGAEPIIGKYRYLLFKRKVGNSP